jgi:Fe-S cluster biogenesis protein NfuA
MATYAELLDRLETLIAELDELEEPVRARVVELLDGIDALHRLAFHRLAEELDDKTLDRARAADPAVAWLLDLYGVGVDERAAAEEALEEIRPYIHSHGGSVEIVDVEEGDVRVRLAGACSGCTASAITLREGVERALQENVPGFRTLSVEEDDAAPHPPPGPTLLQIERLDDRSKRPTSRRRAP